MRTNASCTFDVTKTSKSQRRAAFFSTHTRCCYCNGERPAEEVDHAPARICFRRKEGPEGFEFPSCAQCNRAVALSEQVAAFYIRLMDPGGTYLDATEVHNIISAVCNNSPSSLPILNDLALARMRGEIDSETPASGRERTIQIPRATHDQLELFATKLLYAMFYRVSGTFAGPRHRRMVLWAQEGTQAARDHTRRATSWFGELREGARGNVDIGDQFQYRHGYNVAHGYLGLWMRFGGSAVFFCVLGPAKELATLDVPLKRYQPIRELGLAVDRAHSPGRRGRSGGEESVGSSRKLNAPKIYYAK